MVKLKYEADATRAFYRNICFNNHPNMSVLMHGWTYHLIHPNQIIARENGDMVCEDYRDVTADWIRKCGSGENLDSGDWDQLGIFSEV